MNVGFSTMLALHVLVRDVHVLHGGMVVIVRMRGQQVSPVLTLMEIVGHVVVLVTVLDAVVLVMTLRSRHRAPRLDVFPRRTSAPAGCGLCWWAQKDLNP